MLKRYSNNFQKEKFMEYLEILILQGFGEQPRYHFDTKTAEIMYEIVLRNMAVEEKESKSQKRGREQELKKKTKEMACMLMQHPETLNETLCKDIEKNPEIYSQLLRRKIFNPHKCTIQSDPYFGKSHSTYTEKWSCGNFSLLYSVLSQIIKDEDMAVGECMDVYEKFGFSCLTINATKAQTILMKLYNSIHWIEARRSCVAHLRRR